MAERERTRVELDRRIALLSDEIDRWTAKANANQQQLGIHKSQFEQLKRMMDALVQKQKDMLGGLATPLAPQAFAAQYRDLLVTITGTHELWRVFLYIFSQIQDEQLGPLVDAADLIAADCYIGCRERLTAWGVVRPEQYREPPLVYLEADISPAAVGRGQRVQALGFNVRDYRDLRLPIPVVSLPFDYANCLWLFCAIHHEIGHNVDQDLSLTKELKKELDAKLGAAGVPDERGKIWRRWTSEILADVFGVLLGGAGFAFSLSALLLAIAPASFSLVLDDDHPDPYVRIFLLSQLLTETGVDELEHAAVSIGQIVDAQAKPPGIAPFLDDVKLVAPVLLTQPLGALADHPLRELNTNLEQDAQSAKQLAVYFQTNLGFDKPNPAPAMRLVPVATQLRFMQMDTPDLAALKDLQDRSLGYLRSLPRPNFLAGANRTDFLRQLVQAIDFVGGKEE